MILFTYKPNFRRNGMRVIQTKVDTKRKHDQNVVEHFFRVLVEDNGKRNVVCKATVQYFDRRIYLCCFATAEKKIGLS